MLDFSDYPPMIDSLEGVDPDVLAGVCDAIRQWCGWHIAPIVTDDVLTIDAIGGELLTLPTLRMDEPSVVVDGDERPIGAWRWSEIGQLSRSAGWPAGFRSVTVTVTHGISTAPPEVVAVARHMLDERAAQTVGPALKTAQLDGAMLSYETSAASAQTGILRSLDTYAYAIGRYRL